MRHFAKNMVDTMPVSDRFKFNNVIKKSMMKQVTLNSKSIEGESETSNSENSENSYLNSIYSPTKNAALGDTGNLNNSGGSSDRQSEGFGDDSKNSSQLDQVTLNKDKSNDRIKHAVSVNPGILVGEMNINEHSDSRSDASDTKK